MLIYQDTTEKFCSDVLENVIADSMESVYREHFGRQPGYSEKESWQNSLSRVRDVITVAGLKDDMVALEYEVPYNQSRIDCLLFGKGKNSTSNVVLIELKQWSSVTALEDEGNFLEVETFTGGAKRIVPHPSQQVKGYHNYLKSFVSIFDDEPSLSLYSCAYCHNYKRSTDEGLFDPIYHPLIREFPLYAKEDLHPLAEKLQELLSAGNGVEIFNRFMTSPIRPSKKLLENVSQIVQNEPVFSLLNEQLVAKNLIWSKVRKASKTGQKSVIIVHGGPGTGKSVIAINLLAEAATKRMAVYYGCKSKPFVNGLKDLVGDGAEELFSNLYTFLPSKFDANQADLLLVDEAHRIEKTSNFQYTKPEDRTDMPQVDQLVRCAKTSVFFIDDKQNVRAKEIGRSELIREAAARYNCPVSEVALENQFRCMGSNDYLLWLESILGYSHPPKTLRKDDRFDFQIIDSPKALYEKILKHEEEKPNSARLVAGFCWPWSKKLDANGELVKDVVIGDFAMPWETPDSIRRRPKGYVKWYEWAYKQNGVKQIGCIYTAQGFEFEYIGVIVGNDLVYDRASDGLKTDIKATKDPTLRQSRSTFDTHVRNIYRTLLTRGLRGCYVYFTDKGTEEYFRRHVEH